MLGYRHAFHAGNHADVLKHLVLIRILRHLGAKEKPWWLVDTHAGAGCYALDQGYAIRNAEHAEGIGRLWGRRDLPPALADYVDQVAAFNPSGELRRYPGSPYLALRLSREGDRLRLFELHGTDCRLLGEQLTRDFPADVRRVAVSCSDGFAALEAVLPPPPRRGLVLMDPTYEDKGDYRRVPAAVKEGLKRFATGVYMVWYPKLRRLGEPRLAAKLARLASGPWLEASLEVAAPAAQGPGMYGSSVFVLNPPWTLAAELEACLPFLREVLARAAGARYALTMGGDGRT